MGVEELDDPVVIDLGRGGIEAMLEIPPYCSIIEFFAVMYV